MTRLLIRFASEKRGTAGAEMALMLPLMMIILFTAFEAGHYFYTEQKIIEAVRQGARYAGRLPFDSYTCPSTIDAAATGRIKTVTRTGKVDGTVPLIKGWTDGDITVSVACDSGTTTGVFKGNAGGAPVVTVEATADYTSLFAEVVTGIDPILVRASAQSPVNGI